jgi:hypothetical protein
VCSFRIVFFWVLLFIISLKLRLKAWEWLPICFLTFWERSRISTIFGTLDPLLIAEIQNKPYTSQIIFENNMLANLRISNVENFENACTELGDIFRFWTFENLPGLAWAQRVPSRSSSLRGRPIYICIGITTLTQYMGNGASTKTQMSFFTRVTVHQPVGRDTCPGMNKESSSWSIAVERRTP